MKILIPAIPWAITLAIGFAAASLPAVSDAQPAPPGYGRPYGPPPPPPPRPIRHHRRYWHRPPPPPPHRRPPPPGYLPRP